MTVCFSRISCQHSWGSSGRIVNYRLRLLIVHKLTIMQSLRLQDFTMLAFFQISRMMKFAPSAITLYFQKANNRIFKHLVKNKCALLWKFEKCILQKVQLHEVSLLFFFIHKMQYTHSFPTCIAATSTKYYQDYRHAVQEN